MYSHDMEHEAGDTGCRSQAEGRRTRMEMEMKIGTAMRWNATAKRWRVEQGQGAGGMRGWVWPSRTWQGWGDQGGGRRRPRRWGTRLGRSGGGRGVRLGRAGALRPPRPADGGEGGLGWNHGTHRPGAASRRWPRPARTGESPPWTRRGASWSGAVSPRGWARRRFEPSRRPILGWPAPPPTRTTRRGPPGARRSPGCARSWRGWPACGRPRRSRGGPAQLERRVGEASRAWCCSHSRGGGAKPNVGPRRRGNPRAVRAGGFERRCVGWPPPHPSLEPGRVGVRGGGQGGRRPVHTVWTHGHAHAVFGHQPGQVRRHGGRSLRRDPQTHLRVNAHVLTPPGDGGTPTDSPAPPNRGFRLVVAPPRQPVW